MEQPRDLAPLPVRVDRLFAQSDAAVHAVYAKLFALEVCLMDFDDDKPTREWGEDDE